MNPDSRPLRAFLALACVAAALSACVVVPVDPRTGQPYPYPAVDAARVGAAMTAPAAPVPTTLSARLYPINEPASAAGVLTATVVDTHGGRGLLSLGYRGDTLQGEATRVDAQYAGFGRVHAEVLGAAPRPGGGQRGVANAFGAKGVSARCEYVLTAAAQGTGVCLFSDGAKYQLHFGG